VLGRHGSAVVFGSARGLRSGQLFVLFLEINQYNVEVSKADMGMCVPKVVQ
jgi:hypothetical protein